VVHLKEFESENKYKNTLSSNSLKESEGNNNVASNKIIVALECEKIKCSK
jgi:hypothetical protein